MIDVIVLRLDAPLMAFGGVVIDNIGVTSRFPGRSMLAGLLGNALGYSHGNFDALQGLQDRLRYAVRCDRPGTPSVDYQTVDLAQDFLQEGWTTMGVPEGREGGAARKQTHIRFRHYIADAIYSAALALTNPTESPTINDVEAALREPARPLFIGRKCCIPSAPVFLERVPAATLLDALRRVPGVPGRTVTGALAAWWPEDEETDSSGARLIAITDDRDWANQLHAGRRWMYEGTLRGS